MSVGKQIRIFLAENGISQTWLSEQTRIALPKLNASLNDNRKLSADEFVSIVNILNVDANMFLKKN